MTHTDEKMIVLIDDDTSGLTTSTMLLKRLARRRKTALEVTNYRSGHAFLAAMDRSGVPDAALIILDYDMPGTSGDEICVLLRDVFPQTPIVIYSAYADDTRRARARAAGADAYAEKDPTHVSEQFTLFVTIAEAGSLPAEQHDWLTLFD
jgi:CheY-like chemotaxis protein